MRWLAVLGCTIVGFILLVFVGLLIAASHVSERANRTKSEDNVRTLLTLHLNAADHAGGLQGRNWILSLVAAGVIKAEHRPNLVCLFPTTVAGLDDVDHGEYLALTPERLRTERFPHLTGFCGPGPLEPGWEGPRPLIGDLTHEGGATIGFSDGSVRWLEREELGLGDDDPIEAGPDSRSPILRMLSSE
ncbi:MAG: hypothetical protein QNJ90_03600 [Planctomycetota bacterium]|nr:hypothetical protein [Planctomycetota bacterium]